MGEPMTTFLQRRLAGFTLLLVSGSLLFLLNLLYDISLRDSAFLSGWILLVLMGFLALFNARKKLPVLPLFSGATWLQIHIYLGLLVIGLFLLHSSFRLPDGPFEVLLWWVSMATFVTGLLGLLLSRILPPKLRRHGERIFFERIPIFRAQLSQEAELLAFNALEDSGDTGIANFYWSVLAPFLRKPRNFMSHVVGSQKHIRRLKAQFRALRRYEDEKGREALAKLQEIAEAKDNLDYQYALQLTLKAWLFLHIPLSFVTLILSVTHVLLAYAFASAAP